MLYHIWINWLWENSIFVFLSKAAADKYVAAFVLLIGNTYHIDYIIIFYNVIWRH
jgi:hypothetical protein